MGEFNPNRDFIPGEALPKEERKEYSEKEIWEKLHLYHQTSREKWEAMQKAGAILSEKELIARGLIDPEEKDAFGEPEATSTGSLDREEHRDEYAFASHIPMGYGEVTLEIDPTALEIPGAKVSTAGDWLNFSSDDADRKYHRDSIIPAKNFVSYLSGYLKSLPDPDWFWGKHDEKYGDFLSGGIIKATKGDQEQRRKFWALFPEIMFPRELPLKFVKKVEIED